MNGLSGASFSLCSDYEQTEDLPMELLGRDWKFDELGLLISRVLLEDASLQIFGGLLDLFSLERI